MSEVVRERVPGSTDEIQPWDADALETILEEHIDEDDQTSLPATIPTESGRIWAITSRL